MSVDPVSTGTDSTTAWCWCCGSSDRPDRMVHLGDHPEVRLCLACAHFVHQQAWRIEDDGQPGPAAFARRRLRSLRASVIRRRMHQNKLVGGTLRWAGKYFP